MKTDGKGNKYQEISLGWKGAPDDRLRITEIAGENTFRLNKVDSKNRVYLGPETSIKMIPELIEKLNQIFEANRIQQ